MYVVFPIHALDAADAIRPWSGRTERAGHTEVGEVHGVDIVVDGLFCRDLSPLLAMSSRGEGSRVANTLGIASWQIYSASTAGTARSVSQQSSPPVGRGADAPQPRRTAVQGWYTPPQHCGCEQRRRRSVVWFYPCLRPDTSPRVLVHTFEARPALSVASPYVDRRCYGWRACVCVCVCVDNYRT